MNNIKEKLIHLLGGYTKEDIDLIEKQNMIRVLELKSKCKYEYRRGASDAYNSTFASFSFRFGNSDSDTLKELRRIAAENRDYWRALMNSQAAEIREDLT